MQRASAAIIVLLGLFAAACSETRSSDTEETLPPLVQPSEALAKLSGFAGEYVIVAARNASDVAAPLDEEAEVPIGEAIRFTRNGIEMSAASCDDWRVDPMADAVLPVQSDPNLVDLLLGPTDSPISSGDQQDHQGYVAICEGEEVFRFHKVDDRVLVMPIANSTINLILERPLTELQIKAYQAQLKSMKFYDGELTGTLDEATLRASRIWYENRAELEEEHPIPARPAITENLLDALGVLSDP